RSRGITVCHASNGVQGCDEEHYEESVADVPKLQHSIIIAVVGIRHVLDPAWSIKDAGPVEPYKPKGLVSPTQEPFTLDLIRHEIPYYCTTCEGRISE